VQLANVLGLKRKVASSERLQQQFFFDAQARV
jgi:hypothetical protein